MNASPFPYEGPPEWLPAIEAALRRVVDPEVAMNIVDVGLVVGVACADAQLRVQVTMTSAACPLADVIMDDIEEQLATALPEPVPVAVELVWEPAWTPQRMSERARRFMGW